MKEEKEKERGLVDNKKKEGNSREKVEEFFQHLKMSLKGRFLGLIKILQSHVAKG